jgi:predicted nucleic acid-binding protein
LLLDTSVLIAALDPNEREHRRALQALASHTGQLLTTTGVLLEAMWLLGRRGGWADQRRLWQLVRDGVVVVVQELPLERLAEVMEQYADRPMSLVDASLVVLAEVRKLGRILTLDSDFVIYRTADGRALEVFPA